MIEFIDIKKEFKQDFYKSSIEILKGVNFKVPEHKVVGYLGANGAGKTTSIKIAMDFIRPTSGVVNYHPELLRYKQKFQRIGFLPEKPYLYPHLTGREFCQYMGAISDVAQNDLNVRIKQWSERIDIAYALDKKIQTYSKGMQQRLSFVSILLHNPIFLILDEPMSGLDPIGRAIFKDVIKDLNEQFGTTIFMSGHVVSDIEETCTDLVFMNNGRITYNGRIDEILKDKIDYQIEYIKDGLVREEVIAGSDKDLRVKEIIEKNYSIQSLTKKQQSLEQYFYGKN